MRSPRGKWLVALAFLACALAPGRASAANTLTVGPGKTYAKPCDAIAVAQPGDVIAVDAGSYDGDHCAWSTDNLTVRGVGGRAKIDAGQNQANIANDKGIFDIDAPNATVENFELSGAKADAASANGAGIRHQGTNLTVRNCYFHDNEDGILGSPATDKTGEVTIESSEFSNNGAGDGQSHNMYLNHYAKFTLRFSYSHGAKVGHLVKTRALENHILYNRLTDEAGTTASYELTFPSAGLSYVVGNVIEQSATSQNSAIIDYASEPATLNADSHLFVVNNTIVNDNGGGTFVVDPTATPAVITNNLFVGPGTISSQAGAVLTTNYASSSGDPKLAGQATYDYHLLAGSPCVDKGTDPGLGAGQPLAPIADYVHPLQGEARASVGAIDIGAYEFGNPGGPVGDGGAGDSGTSGGTSGSTGGTSGSTGGTSGSTGGTSGGTGGTSGGSAGDGGSGAGAQPGSSGGCGCRLGAARETAGVLLAACAALAFGARRRRRAR